MNNFIGSLVSVSFVFLTLACGSSSDDKAATTTTSTTWTDTNMQALVSSNCATSGCHDGTQSPNYKTITEANMKLDTLAKTRVAAGTMPPVTTLTSTQKATVANFYR